MACVTQMVVEREQVRAQGKTKQSFQSVASFKSTSNLLSSLTLSLIWQQPYIGVNIHFTSPAVGEMEMIRDGGFRYVRMVSRFFYFKTHAFYSPSVSLQSSLLHCSQHTPHTHTLSLHFSLTLSHTLRTWTGPALNALVASTTSLLMTNLSMPLQLRTLLLTSFWIITTACTTKDSHLTPTKVYMSVCCVFVCVWCGVSVCAINSVCDLINMKAIIYFVLTSFILPLSHTHTLSHSSLSHITTVTHRPRRLQKLFGCCCQALCRPSHYLGDVQWAKYSFLETGTECYQLYQTCFGGW